MFTVVYNSSTCAYLDFEQAHSAFGDLVLPSSSFAPGKGPQKQPLLSRKVPQVRSWGDDALRLILRSSVNLNPAP